MIPGQGTRSHMLQLRVRMPQLKIQQAATKIPHTATKILCAVTKTQRSQINKQILKKKERGKGSKRGIKWYRAQGKTRKISRMR